MNNNISCSVRLMTFNHEKYIIKALESVDSQITNFKFELVIGDDFSTDQTLKLIKNYTFKNKNIIVNILNRKVNDEYYIKRKQFGRIYNYLDIVNKCKSEIIFILDGDDFWIDNLKMQKQYDKIKGDNSISIVSSNHELHVNGKKIYHKKFKKNIEFNFDEYLNHNVFITSSSLCIRKSIFKNYTENYFDLFAADFVIKYLALSIGNLYIFKDTMSVYNKFTLGSWSKRILTSEIIFKEFSDNKFILDIFLNNKSILKKSYTKKIKQLKARKSFQLIKLNHKNHFKKIIIGLSKIFEIKFKRFIKLIITK